MINYFTTQYAIKVHDIVIDISGGRRGILNQGLLESTLGHIQNDTFYPTFIDKLTHLVFSISKNHSFVDGNKRSALLLGSYFILINIEDSEYYVIAKFIREMEDIILNVVKNKINKSLLKEIMASILTGNPYDEALKIRIIKSINSNK